MLEFSVQPDVLEDFARTGIACPPAVLRSVPKRQAEYLAGRRAAVAALREQGCDVTDLATATGRAPAWPRGFVGSITHADGIAAAVAMRAGRVQGIGIDVEHVADAQAVDAIRQIAVSGPECERLAAFAGTLGWPFVLTLAFSAKESFYKAAYASLGRFFDFGALTILRCMPERGIIEAEVTDTLSDSIRTGMRLTITYRRLGERLILTSCAL